MCEPHAQQFRGRHIPISLEQFLSDPRVRPQPPLPACLVPACTRTADGAIGYCNTHYQRWRVAQQDPAEPDERWWRGRESGVAEPGQVNLRALPELVVVEVLIGLQTRVREGLRLTDVVLRAVCDTLRRHQVASIHDCEPGPGAGQAGTLGAGLVRPRRPPRAGRSRCRAGQGPLGSGDLRSSRHAVVHQDHPALAGRGREAVGGRAAAAAPRQRRLSCPRQDQQHRAAVRAPAPPTRPRARPGRAGSNRPGGLPQSTRPS